MQGHLPTCGIVQYTVWRVDMTMNNILAIYMCTISQIPTLPYMAPPYESLIGAYTLRPTLLQPYSWLLPWRPSFHILLIFEHFMC